MHSKISLQARQKMLKSALPPYNVECRNTSELTMGILGFD